MQLQVISDLESQICALQAEQVRRAATDVGALARGEISLWSARQISHQVSLLDDRALRWLADEVIATEAPGLPSGKVKKLGMTRGMGIDPAAADARAFR